ncbi:MAG: hypothetical protein JWP27_1941 [Flaviaesturariibacter sp.]|nr:hypothetical protein [Flaviaesturariibacter sp.]
MFHFISRLLLTGSLLLVVCIASAQAPTYNKALADSLGADEYGMKSYVLVILKGGSGKADKERTDSLFAGHLRNIQRLARIGKLVVAGPMEDNEKGYRGIFILNVRTMEEAKALLATDPAIGARLLEPELYGWYGSAALPLYLPSAEKVTKKAFDPSQTVLP